ncbi:MAG TPA: phosphate signaling complex protein PhoU [Planctomycetota bacterium]|nr:phosphate signaling complex protein PhoU [Planctomycetota bacterium]
MIHRHFEEALAELKGRLVRMGTLAEAMVDEAVRSLLERAGDRHAEVYRREEEVNALHLEIDERAIGILALQHPVAADLRLVVMSSKIAGELERIADQAVNICQNTAHLLKYPPLKPLIDIPLMADRARAMLRESLDAFVRSDAALARKVLRDDDAVDALKDQVFRELLTYMMADPGTIPRALDLILVSRNLERVADHATNIAEEAIYAAEGKDVRHHHEQEQRSGEGE